MSSNRGPGPTPRDPQPSVAPIFTMFVCPGAKDVPIDYAIFPHGGGFSQMAPCPGRDICVWYAAHDLGGGTEINDLPDAMILPAHFQAQPFSCPHFRDMKRPCARRERRSKKPDSGPERAAG